MGKKKKINELEDRYYDLLNEIGVLEDRVKGIERRRIEDLNLFSDRMDKSECAHSYEGSELKKLNEKIELIRDDFCKLNAQCENMETKIKVLNDRTMVDYTSINAAPKDEITFEDCNKILEWCAKRGATKEELDGLRLMFNKYVFGCVVLFPIKEDDND